MDCGLVPPPQTPLHLPLLYRWERFRVIGARSRCLWRLPIFLPQPNGGADHKSMDCASARNGEGSSTSSTSALCTQQEHPFPPSPSREMCCDVPVRPQLLSSDVFSYLLHRRVIRTRDIFDSNTK